MLRVLYDGSIFHKQPRGGISVVFQELFKRMGADRRFRCWCTVPWSNGPRDTAGVKRLSIPRLPQRGFDPRWWRLWNDAYCLAVRPDVLHGTYYTHPGFWGGARTVVTIHDMIYELFPDEFCSRWDRELVALKKALAHRADAVVCVSACTRTDVLRFYPDIDPAKVHVVHNAVSGRFLGAVTDEEKEHFRQECALPRPYVLYVGKLDSPYKNFDVLLDVYVADPVLRHRVDLVLVSSGPMSARQTDAVRGLGDRVHQFSGVSDRRLKLFYACSSVFVYPSKYEGFGLPILEAMASGAPVITADVSSMPEVAGDAALLFHPGSRDDLRRCLVSVLDSDSLRTGLVNRGFSNLSRFSWDDSAQKLGQIYAQVCSRLERGRSPRGSVS